MVLNSRKEVRLFMKTEKEKMISGEKYNPANPRLVLERARANRIYTRYFMLSATNIVRIYSIL